MTLITLLVAMALGLLVVLLATTMLLISRQGFAAVDATAQLHDDGRFLQTLVQRLGRQTGYKDLLQPLTGNATPDPSCATPCPDIFGLNNAAREPEMDWDAGTERAAGTVGYGSDILVLRYGISTTPADASTSDGTMIDCSGSTSARVAQTSDTLVSILHVAESNGEPALMCSRSEDGNPPYVDTEPLITGVENFQVLYGVGDTADKIAGRYVRADQLPREDTNIDPYVRWRNVRSVRIGVVLRGPPGSAIDRLRTPETLYPLGIARNSAAGAPGSAFASASDPGSIHTPAPDGRLRQVVTFTVRLRNAWNAY